MIHETTKTRNNSNPLNNLNSYYGKLIFVLFILFTSELKAQSNYYWVGGTGSWNDYSTHWSAVSGGQIFHVQVPGPKDTVIFDSLSFAAHDTVYCDTAMLTCHTMKWKNVQFHPVFITRFVSSANILKIYGSLYTDTNMTWNYGGKIIFKAFAGNDTIKTGGQNLGYITFEGNNGAWNLKDSLFANRIHFKKGTFRSHGKSIHCSELQFLNNDTSAVYLDSSRITVLDSFYVNSNILNFDADSTTIFMRGNWFFGGNKNYGTVYFPQYTGLYDSNSFHKAVFGTYSTVYSNNTFDTLQMSRPGVTLSLAAGSTQTINDTLEVNGDCSALSVIETNSYGSQATIYKASGTLNLNFVLLEDVNTVGAATFNTNYSVAMGTCNGWNMTNTPSPRNMFWVGGSGKWTDINHWSLISGGTGGNCVPDPFDNVYFDANSFQNAGDTVDLDGLTTYANNLDWTGATGNPLFKSDTASNKLKIYSSFTLIPQMNYANNTSLWFRSNNSGNTIASCGHSHVAMEFWGTGDWKLLDDLNCSQVNITQGIFLSNDKNISSGSFASISGMSRTISLGTSNINTSWWNMQGSNLNLDADSTIITVNSFDDWSFLSSGQNYNVVNFPNGAWMNSSDNFHQVQIDGDAFINYSNQFDTLSFNSGGYTIVLGSGTTQTINGDLIMNGTCSGLVGFESNSLGSQATILKTNGAITINYAVMQDIYATGGANFIAMFCYAASNVTGWNVTPIPPNNFYWIGGTGNWNDPNHWSLTSGGPAGVCTPSPTNDVFFDANSFSGNGEAVTLNAKNSYCKTMDWTGASGSPSFASGGKKLKIYGSLTMQNAMSTSGVPFIFRSMTSFNSILCAQQHLGYMGFEGIGGKWSLLDSTIADSIHITSGIVNTLGNYIQAGKIRSLSNISRVISLDSSHIEVGIWEVDANSLLTLNTDSSTIDLVGKEFTGGNRKYHDLNLHADATILDADTFRILSCSRMANLNGSNTIDTLILEDPGYQLTLGSGTTQTLNGKFYVFASSTTPIAIESSDEGDQASISKIADTVCLDYLNLQDIVATGGAVFFAGSHSTDVNNNLGWSWGDCHPLSNVWPGDANYDLTANNFDVLNIGLGYGYAGPTRPNANLNWVAQPMWDWSMQFPDSINLKHGDCDGNGIVDMNDTQAIALNYGQLHQLQNSDAQRLIDLPSHLSGPAIYYGNPIGNPMPDSTISLQVILGSSTNSMNNIYGAAFSILYDANQIVNGSMHVSYDTSWLVTANNNVHLEKDFSTNGQLDIGMCRTDHHDTSGYGCILTITFKLGPNANGYSIFAFGGIKFINKDGEEIIVNGFADFMPILPAPNTQGISPIGSANSISVFPNPSNGKFTIDENLLNNNGCLVEIYDLTGKMIASQRFEAFEKLNMDITDQAPGIYSLKLISGDKLYTQRLVVQK